MKYEIVKIDSWFVIRNSCGKFHHVKYSTKEKALKSLKQMHAGLRKFEVNEI